MTAARIFLAFVFVSLVAPAGAQADLVIRDTRARPVFALHGVIVWQRVSGEGSVSRTRPWMRSFWVGTSRARGVPRGARGSAIGRDYNGRVALTMATHRGGGTQWWIYDVKRDRARRLTSLPGPCAPRDVSIWRRHVAYVVNGCRRRSANGVFLRTDGRVRHLAGESAASDLFGWHMPVLRESTLLAVSENGDGDRALWRITDRGRVCPSPVPGASLTGYGFRGAWIEILRAAARVQRQTLLWWPDARNDGARDTGGLVGAELGGTCEPPGPTGYFPLPERPTRTYHREVVHNSLYYSERDGIHVTYGRLRPVTGPPPNDDFAAAEPLPAEPLSREVTIGNATTEPGEPALGARSMWFSFQASASRPLVVSGAEGVFTGSSVSALQPVGTKDGSGVIKFRGQAGQTYSIAVACPPSPDYDFTCHLPRDLAIRRG